MAQNICSSSCYKYTILLLNKYLSWKWGIFMWTTIKATKKWNYDKYGK